MERLELIDCVVEDSVFAEAQLERCSFEDTTFRRCDLGVMKLGGTAFRDVRFEDCKVTGIDWSRAHDLAFDVSFADCVLDMGSFVGLRLKGLKIEGGRARDVVFADSDLRDVRFGYVDFASATFTGNDLRGADLATCANVVVEPNTNRFGKTKLPTGTAKRYLKQLGIIVPGM